MEPARYVRITHRLARGVASADDDASQALAEVLQRRIVESIAIECARLVTSDLLSERLAQAAAALGEHGIVMQVIDGGLAIDGCFCESKACQHPKELIQQLIGTEVAPITTQDGRRVLRVLGVLDAASYTQEASTSVFKA